LVLQGMQEKICVACLLSGIKWSTTNVFIAESRFHIRHWKKDLFARHAAQKYSSSQERKR